MSTSTPNRIPAPKAASTKRRWMLIGGGGSIVAAIIAVAVTLLVPRTPSPTAVADKFLHALADGDRATVKELLGSDPDGQYTEALANLGAIASPITHITVRKVDEWGQGHGKREQEVTYSVVLDGKKYDSKLIATRAEDGRTAVYSSDLLGTVTLETSGPAASLEGVKTDRRSVSLFPGVYKVVKKDLPFPYKFPADSAVVTPGSGVDVAVERDELAILAVWTDVHDKVDKRARADAEAALTDGRLPLERLSSFGHQARGLNLAKLTYEKADFNGYSLVFAYKADYAGEKWYGSINYEWMPIQASTKLLVTVPIDETGKAGEPIMALDSNALYWH